MLKETKEIYRSSGFAYYKKPTKEITDLITRNPDKLFYLPSTVIITEPQIVSPLTARAWRTSYYYIDNTIMTYDEAVKRTAANLASKYTARYVAELWEDCGEYYPSFSLRGYICGTLQNIENYYLCMKEAYAKYDLR